MPPHDLIQSLQQAIGNGGDQVFDVVPTVLRRVLEDRLWAQRKDKEGQPFRSFEAFATHILWQGLESSIEDLLLYCRKHPEIAKLIKREVATAAEHGGDRKSATAKDQGSNATLIGRGSVYNLARLKRDRPDLAEKVVTGKMSAYAAAIEAGFRKRPEKRPFERILQLLDRLSVEEVRKLRINVEAYLWFREHEHEVAPAVKENETTDAAA